MLVAGVMLVEMLAMNIDKREYITNTIQQSDNLQLAKIKVFIRGHIEECRDCVSLKVDNRREGPVFVLVI